jgi:hypothetical protein
MTARGVYLSVSALAIVLLLIVIAPMLVEREVGLMNLHGPVSIIAALPFAAIYFIGSVVLAIVVARSRVPTLSLIVG